MEKSDSALDALLSRRSVRAYKPDAVPKEAIQKIIEAGLYAASAMGKQDTIVIAVTNKGIRARISEMNRKIGGWEEGFDPFYGAPAILVVLADKNEKNRVYDGSLMMGNMMNAARALGLGSIWIHRAKEEFDSAEGRAILDSLGVKGEWEGVGHCAVGFARGDIPAAAPRKEGRVFWAE